MSSSKEYMAAYRAANKERIAAKVREWKDRNKEAVAEYNRQYQQANSEAIRDRHRDYRSDGRGRAYSNAYHARKLQRTPKWADLQAIQEFYKNCPPGMHVDHIIPLQGELVSGLHVHNNLQYLTQAENSAKHNKFQPELWT